MSEENVKASLEFDVNKAVREVNRAITAFSKIEPTTARQAKSLSSVEKRLVSLASKLQTTSQASKKNAQAVQQEAAAYRELLKAQGVVRGANNAYRDAQTGRFVKNPLADFNLANIKATQKAEADLARQQERTSRAQVAYARDATNAGLKYGQAIQGANQSLITQRYALYDVARTWTMVSTAALGAATAVLGFSIQHEAAFAQVRRTTDVYGREAVNLRNALTDLGTAIPMSFTELAEIGSLGGQLGIAKDGIEDFTDVTAKLAATSDLTADSAGKMIGRFQALLGVTPTEFENLASSVSLVGVNSVATESQIANIATQISAMGNFAGLTADQVVGLSGALASVGVQPELARGTVTRTFTNMSVAVAEGGERLQTFARISGVSAEQFRNSWGTETFADTFQAFLRGLSEEGDDAVASLRELGITSVRDIPALLRLADAGDVVSRAFGDASQGWDENTELARQFGEISENVAAKLQRLGNAIQGILAQGGPTDFLSGLLGVVLKLSEGFLAIARNPIGKFFLGLMTAVSLLVGAFTGLLAMKALATASLFGMQTALQSLTKNGISSTGIMRQYVAVIKEMTGWTAIAATRQEAMNLALARGAGKAHAQAVGLKAAAVSANAFGISLRSALITTGIGAILVGIGFAVEKLTSQINTATLEFSGMAEAIKKDSQAFNEYTEAVEQGNETTAEAGDFYRTLSREISSSSDELSDWAKHLQDSSGTQIELNDRTRDTTESIKEQTVALGANARAQLAEAVANNEAFQKFYEENREILTEIGFDFGEYFNAVLQGSDEAHAYLERFNEELRNAMMHEDDTTGALLNEYAMEASRALEAIGELAGLTGQFTDQLEESLAKALYESDMYGAIADGADDLGDELDELANSYKSVIDAQYEMIGNTAAVQGSLNSLGQSLAENGTSFSAYSEAGRANLSALQQTMNAMAAAAGDDSAQLAAMLAGLMQQLSSFGVDAVNELGFVQAAIAQLSGGKALIGVAQHAEMAGVGLERGFAGGAQKAAKAAKQATKEVRTLTDYVKDLTRIFRDAFEFRFGLDNSSDDVAEAWLALRDNSDKAAESVRNALQAIREADAEIKGLKASQTTLEYQLTVAQEYGDTLRANQILAEMAENQAKLSKVESDRVGSQKELKDAQDAMSKSLDGSTKSSREQRDLVQSLLQSYMDQVAALANTGLSQKQLEKKTAELRAEFIKQMRQLGYNATEINKYARTFDDLTYAINKVPRNLTISANTNPAIRAVDEYTASLRKAQSAASSLGKTNISPNFNDERIKKAARGMELLSRLIAAQKALERATHPSHISAIQQTIEGLMLRLNSGRYQEGGQVQRLATGGVAGLHPGSPQGTDTTPAWLTPGEYVHKKAAVQHYGLPFMNALNNMQLPKYLSAGGSVSGATSHGTAVQLVELLPTQIAQIVDALYVRIDIDGSEIAASVNQHNVRSTRRGMN